MASFIPRSNVLTQSEANIFNDSHKLTYTVKIVNTSARRIVWAIKTKEPNRLGVEPGCGVLDPSETMHVMVSCNFAIE
uniref:MSP domain-containing protein n=1 Tax=Acrobeloides nanus TaxID=290746 RepID=A0A914CYB0_9BILA